VFSKINKSACDGEELLVKEGNFNIINLRRIEWAERAECKIKLRDNVFFVQAMKVY
jgi:hypothetical protein